MRNREIIAVGWTLLVVVSAGALAVTTQPVLRAVAQPAAGPDAFVAAASAMAAWAVLAWLTLSLALTLVHVAMGRLRVPDARLRPVSSALSFALSFALSSALTLLAPRRLVTAVQSSLYAGVIVSSVGGLGVACWLSAPASAGERLSLATPSTTPSTTQQAHDRDRHEGWFVRRLSVERPATRLVSERAKHDRPTYTVRPGDSLWSIAADHLRAGASQGDIAREWPRWWSTNRDEIGPDPALIHPGQTLTPPRGLR